VLGRFLLYFLLLRQSLLPFCAQFDSLDDDAALLERYFFEVGDFLLLDFFLFLEFFEGGLSSVGLEQISPLVDVLDARDERVVDAISSVLKRFEVFLDVLD